VTKSWRSMQAQALTLPGPVRIPVRVFAIHRQGCLTNTCKLYGCGTSLPLDGRWSHLQLCHFL
jgi:hypothetical protein